VSNRNASATRLTQENKLKESLDFQTKHFENFNPDHKTDKLYQVYMKAPYKLMDKKMDQRQARGKEVDKFRFLANIPITNDALYK
jgi:hypothetical protein